MTQYGNAPLPAKERINILSKRLINLRNGKGGYRGKQLEQAILDTELTLEDAFAASKTEGAE